MIQDPNISPPEIIDNTEWSRNEADQKLRPEEELDQRNTEQEDYSELFEDKQSDN